MRIAPMCASASRRFTSPRSIDERAVYFNLTRSPAKCERQIVGCRGYGLGSVPSKRGL